jgi:hypothetical protein
MYGENSNLWSHTLGYGARGPKVNYLTDEQNCRLERIRVARMLWKGSHRRAFLDEQRTQFNFPEALIQGQILRPYITLNILKLITTTVTDLLLGEEALLTVEDEAGYTQQAMDDLKGRSDLHRVFYDAVKGASWSGEGMVEITRWDGQVYIQDVKADEVFPLGKRQPDGQFASYVRFATARAVAETVKGRRLLLESLYLPGEIRRTCYLVDADGNRQDAVDLALWPVTRPDGSPLPPVEATGIDWNSIVWMANELDEGCPTSDYDGLIELQDELNSKQTQIARVIAKHADPKLAAPQADATPDGSLRSGQDVYFYRTKDEIPSYITWNAELASAIEDRNFTLTALCIAAETSQGLLGLEQGAAPDSARKLRLQATKSLARVKRKGLFVRPFLRTAIDTALLMINAGSRVQIGAGGGSGGDGGANVELRDGLPIDELDQAQTISLLTGGRATMSVERAVMLQIPDPDAAAQEIERIKAESAAATPSVLLGPPADPAADPQEEIPPGGTA